MSWFVLLLILLSVLVLETSSYNIVFYASVIGKSHLSFLKTATNILVKRGHNVDVVFAHFNDLVEIYPLPGIRRNYTLGFDIPGYWKTKCPHLLDTFYKPPRPLTDLANFDDICVELCEVAVNSPALLEFLKSGKYDIGITNDYDPCGVIMMNAAKIPSTASLIPTPMFQNQIVYAGLPSITSVYGSTLTPEHDGSFYDKLFHLIRSTYYIYYHLPKLHMKYNELVKSKAEFNFTSVEELERNIDLILVNSNEIIERPRPISHKIKYIGGMGMKRAKPLKKKIESIVAIPSEGIVLFSFGTQVATKSIPLNIRRNFVEAFKQFPDYTFIWKYDNVSDDNDIFDKTTNIHRVEWLPQTDLLQDARIKLFISHMGLNSFLETSLSGVPVLSIPLFIDQQNNAQNAAMREMGLIVNRDQLTVDNIVEALKELLSNPKYGENARIISNMMRDKPEQSEKEFVQWLEYAAKYPGLHKIANLPGADYSPFWYYSGDVIVSFVFMFIIIIILIQKCLSFVIFKLLLSRKTENKQKVD